MDYKKAYQESLELGKQFEEYCYRWIEVYKRTKISRCEGKETQVQVGENYFGIEFKLDQRFRQTQRLYIELKERSSPFLGFTPSGIYRKDNTFIYAIGDWETLYLFDKNRLRKVHEWAKRTNPPGHLFRETPTSVGWCLPIQYVEEEKLTAAVWDLSAVTNDEINKARGFVIETPPQRKRKREENSGQIPLIQPDKKQLTLL